MKWNLNYFVLLILTLALNAHAGFSSGDQFRMVNISGTLSLACKNETITITCRDVFMDPWPYDVFVGPKDQRARTVILKSDIQTAVVDYNGTTGKSDQINLGVSSLLQKPLLKVGTNTISYSVRDKSDVDLQSGEFAVSVSRGDPRVCSAKVAANATQENCDYPYSLCQMYFRDQNYCR